MVGTNTFAELTRQVHRLNDLILSDILISEEEYTKVAENFNRHLYSTKYWFMRTSYANKKRFLLALLQDLRSGWALSLLLKSIWNCRTKDAVFSFWNKPHPLSVYDQIPLDHNRTAQPLKALAQVMTDERRWFHTLNHESQAMMLLELASSAGGPIMLEFLHRAQSIYEFNHDAQLRNLLECIVVGHAPPPSHATTPDKGSMAAGGGDDNTTHAKGALGHAMRELEANLNTWNSVIKSIRDSTKLEEVVMTFKDRTQKKIWKVNRVRPEATETLDYIQLIPANLAKRILSYFPRNTLPNYAKVNKYWAFLVDEMNAEWAARNKINADIEKLQDMMFKHDDSLEMIPTTGTNYNVLGSVTTSVGASTKGGHRRPLDMSMKASEKSAGTSSFRHYFDEKFKTQIKKKPKVIQNLAELQDRLDARGAADENLWDWCRYMVQMTKTKKKSQEGESGVLRCEGKFPTPLMNYDLNQPMVLPVGKDPAVAFAVLPKTKKNVGDVSLLNLSKEQKEPTQRFSLWSRDFSSLYKVFKVASYESPI